MRQLRQGKGQGGEVEMARMIAGMGSLQMVQELLLETGQDSKHLSANNNPISQ